MGGGRQHEGVARPVLGKPDCRAPGERFVGASESILNLPPVRSESKLAALMRSPAFAVVAAIGAAIRLFWIVYINCPPNVQLDFSSFYLFALAMRHHLNPYQLDMTLYAARHNVLIGTILRANYPPTFYLMLEPLTHLTPWHAYWFWCAISVVLLFTSLWILIPAKKEVPLPAAITLMALAIMFRPIQIHFEFLQVQILILFLLILMWHGLRQNNDILAGTSLAFAGLLKVYPLFMMLYLVCARRWRALGFTLIGLIIGSGLTLAFVGSRSFDFFATVVAHVNPAAGVPQVPTVGIAGATYRIFHHLFPDDNRAIVIGRRIIYVATELLVLALTALAIDRSRGNSRREEYAFGVCVAAMILCFSNSWAHYMVLLLFPLSQIALASEIGAAPVIAPALAIIGYILAEVSYSTAYWSFQYDRTNLGLWLIEGLFISTALTYVAAYILATVASNEAETEIVRAS